MFPLNQFYPDDSFSTRVRGGSMGYADAFRCPRLNESTEIVVHFQASSLSTTAILGRRALVEHAAHQIASRNSVLDPTQHRYCGKDVKHWQTTFFRADF